MIQTALRIFCSFIFMFIPIFNLDANSSQIVGVNAYVDNDNNVKLGWSVVIETDVSSVDVNIKHGESKNLDITHDFVTTPFARNSGQYYTISNTELKPETTYYYQITVAAGVNGLLESEIYSFVTKAECDVSFTDSLEGKEFMEGDTVSINWKETNVNSILLSVMDSLGTSKISHIAIENSGNYKWKIPDDFLGRSIPRFFNIKLDVFCTDSRSSAQTENFHIGTIKDLKLPDENTPALDTDIYFTFPAKDNTLRLNKNYYVKWTMPEEKKKGTITLWLEGKKLANGNYQIFPMGGITPGTGLPPISNNGIFDWYVQDKYEHNNVMKLEYYTYERDPSKLNTILNTHRAQKQVTDEKIIYNFPPQIIEPGQYRLFGIIYYDRTTPNSLFYSDHFNISESDENLYIPTNTENSKIITNTISTNKSKIEIQNKTMHSRLKGKIVLKVDDAGKAYYIHPKNEEMYYLGKPTDAFSVMREQGVGIKNVDLEKIEIGSFDIGGEDSDNDGLSDAFENAVGTNKSNSDTDGDGYDDKTELLSGYNPKGQGKMIFDNVFTNKNKGRIFIQVEGKGEAWYVNPKDSKRYFLGRPADAFGVMRNLGLGISNTDFDNMQ
jgi:hypothetical protein